MWPGHWHTLKDNSMTTPTAGWERTVKTLNYRVDKLNLQLLLMHRFSLYPKHNKSLEVEKSTLTHTFYIITLWCPIYFRSYFTMRFTSDLHFLWTHTALFQFVIFFWPGRQLWVSYTVGAESNNDSNSHITGEKIFKIKTHFKDWINLAMHCLTIQGKYRIKLQNRHEMQNANSL